MSPARFAMRNHTSPVSTQPPIATVTIYAQQFSVTPTPSAHSDDRDTPNAMIIGLAIVPVVIISVGLCILFLFWSRRRRVRRNLHRTSRTPPPVPEKDLDSYNSSIASPKGSSKVFHMRAFSAPIERDGRREAQFSEPVALQTMEPKENKNRKTEPPRLAPLDENQVAIDADLDSPIDGSSPFRLKRGDTVKRHSLGPELARLWPSSPASARLKAPSPVHELLPPPPPQRKPPVYHLSPMPRQHEPPHRF